MPGPRPPRRRPITSDPPRRRLPPMGESPRAGPTRCTDPTSAATAAGLVRTQHGGGQAGPNYKQRPREGSAVSAEGGKRCPSPRLGRSPLALLPTEPPAHLHASAEESREEQEPPPRSCGGGQCRGLRTPEGRGSVRHGDRSARGAGAQTRWRPRRLHRPPSPSPSFGALTPSYL